MTQAQHINAASGLSASSREDAEQQRPFAPAGTILILAACLMLIGILMVFSTSARVDRPFWPENPLRSTPVRQAAFTAVALLMMWIAYGLGYRWLRWRGTDIRPLWEGGPTASSSSILQPTAILLVLLVGCLVAAVVPGIGELRHGARRWLQFGPTRYGLGFQPSEFAKIILITFLAGWLTHRRAVMSRFWRGIIPPVVVVGGVTVLVVLEDLGTAALLALVGGTMIVAAGARWWHAGLLSMPGVVGFLALIWLVPYRLERVTSYKDIWADPLDSGYHAIQSLIAIAAGGWFGQGIGSGTQKYGYLPEAQSDFIFAIVCEEMGLLGGFAVLAMVVCIVLCGWLIMSRCQDTFGKLLALGITLMFGFQAAMNIAVVTVSVPTKGISLPLVSAGGSGLIVYGAALGLLASIARHRP